jgi:hypothetical protein
MALFVRGIAAIRRSCEPIPYVLMPANGQELLKGFLCETEHMPDCESSALSAEMLRMQQPGVVIRGIGE